MSSVLRRIKKEGLKKTIVYAVKKKLGITKLEEENDTLFYILNRSCSVSEFPKASGALRNLQECDAVLLKIVTSLCTQNSLKYWLEAGTLLGAKRHQGFIPWDDDLDISLPRDDWEKAKIVLPDVVNSLGLEFKFHHPEETSMSFAIGYKHDQTGVWIDLFPADMVSNRGSVPYIKSTIDKYKKAYKRLTNKTDKAQVEKCRHRFFQYETEPSYVCIALEYPGAKNVHSFSSVFPLKQIEFENDLYMCPNNVDEYLSAMYGTNYMSFPRLGVEHHGGSEKLSLRADINNIDMAVIRDELNQILLKIKR